MYVRSKKAKTRSAHYYFTRTGRALFARVLRNQEIDSLLRGCRANSHAPISESVLWCHVTGERLHLFWLREWREFDWNDARKVRTSSDPILPVSMATERPYVGDGAWWRWRWRTPLPHRRTSAELSHWSWFTTIIGNDENSPFPNFLLAIFFQI